MGLFAVVGDNNQLAGPRGHDDTDYGQKRPQGREEPSRLSHDLVLLSGRQASLMQAPLFVDMHGCTRRAHWVVPYGPETLPSICQSQPAASSSSRAANRPPRRISSSGGPASTI